MGRDRDGRDRDGYDYYGIDAAGFGNLRSRYYNITDVANKSTDRTGLNNRRQDIEGYFADGCGKIGSANNASHVLTCADIDGFDREGMSLRNLPREWYDEEMYDPFGFDVFGYTRAGLDCDSRDVYGYDLEGFGKELYVRSVVETVADDGQISRDIMRMDSAKRATTGQVSIISAEIARATQFMGTMHTTGVATETSSLAIMLDRTATFTVPARKCLQ